MSIGRFVLIATLLVLPAVSLGTRATADNWPYWRGPQNNGVCEEKNLPAEFDKSKNVVWRVPLPGQAAATPVVWDDHIFLTAPDGDELLLICMSTDGREQWRRTVGHGNRLARVDEGNSCSPSPVTDGKHVWTLMGSGDLACFDFNGTPAWSLNLQKNYGKFRISYGMSSTPVLDGDRLYCQLIHGDGDATTHEAIVLALDKRTGKEIWKHTRISDAIVECEQSYASPMMYDDGKLKFLLTHGADYLVAHRLEDGKEICAAADSIRRPTTIRRCGWSPRRQPCQASSLFPPPRTGLSLPCGPMAQATSRMQSNTSSGNGRQHARRPLSTDPRRVGLSLSRNGGPVLSRRQDRAGVLSQTDKTDAVPRVAGLRRWQDLRHFPRRRCDRRQGGEGFKILARNELGEQIAASPAISNGRIYFRTFEALWAVAKQ